MADYVRWLRERVGHAPVQLNFVGAAIVIDGKILLQRRSDDGSWGFPGGAIELGESAEMALIREVDEETGLRVSVDTILGVYTRYRHTYPNGDVVQPMTIFFRCTALGGTLQSTDSETLELRMFPLAAPPRLVNPQHVDAWQDLCSDREAVFR